MRVLHLLTVLAFLNHIPSIHSFTGSSGLFRGNQNSSSRASTQEEWKGEIIAGNDQQIRGCTLTQAGSSLTQWTIAIDGVQADLGRFSQVVYKKIMQDAKRERFQGFRPGTIVPPHLLPTYQAFAMDECARETVLEAMQQNNIRPFENCRTEMNLEQICIPPAKRKKKGKKKKSAAAEPESPEWRTYDTMKEAIDAGWQPGQSFSFVADNVKGQQLKKEEESKPLGLNF